MALLHDPQRVKKGHSSPGRLPGGSKPVLLEQLETSDLLRACEQLRKWWEIDSETWAGLLGTSRSSWFRWLEALETGKAVALSGDQRARALALLRIFEAVADLHHEDQDACRWIHEPLAAPGFGDRAPLVVMASGFEGLLMVRDYLDFLHGAWT